ncbi:MAG: hypothetical protein JSS20_10570 [Proteobacteria bacterium]|nr:hypothetical protein [Pseudomonadota bacterium]
MSGQTEPIQCRQFDLLDETGGLAEAEKKAHSALLLALYSNSEGECTHLRKTLTEEIERLHRHIAGLDHLTRHTQAALHGVSAERNDLQAKLAQAEARLQDISADLAQITGECDQLQNENDRLRREQAGSKLHSISIRAIRRFVDQLWIKRR